MKRRLVVVIATAFVVVAATVAHGQTPVRQGYWWIAETGLVTVPGPSSVPANGLYVASDPAQTEAVAAVRLPAAPRRLVQLDLRAADVEGTPSLVACATTGNWTPGGPNAWSTQPAADCEKAEVAVQPDLAQKHWTVPLSPFVAAGVQSILLQPGKPGQVSVSFDAVDLHSFTIEAPASRATPPSGASSQPRTSARSGGGDAQPANGQQQAAGSVPPVQQPPNIPDATAGVPPTAQTPQIAPTTAPATTPTTSAAAAADVSKPSYLWVLFAAWLVLTAWIWRARRSMRLLDSHPLASTFELAAPVTPIKAES